MANLTHERLLSVLSYDADSGVFRWKTKQGKGMVGSVAGSANSAGYVRIMIDGERFLAHRLAWFYVYGRWPIAQIDHREVDNSDNRISALREASQSQNQMNRRLQKNNTSGFKGVDFEKRSGLYRARIKKDRKVTYLGYFKTGEEAYVAYVAAANDNFKEFARFL